jgi:hypothetical protein
MIGQANKQAGIAYLMMVVQRFAFTAIGVIQAAMFGAMMREATKPRHNMPERAE